MEGERVRFEVSPTEQLRINFDVAPKSDASWNPAAAHARQLKGLRIVR
jgi:hypothetical protein